MEEKKNNKGLIIVLIMFLIICLVGSGYFIYKMVYVGIENKEQNTNKDNNIQQDIYLDVSSYKYNLDVYRNKNNQSELCLTKNDTYCTEVAFSIKAETENAKLLSFNLDKDFILYDDNGLKIYNINLNKYKKINLENTYQKYEIYSDNDKNQIIGIVYHTSNENAGYYNVLLNKKLYENQYKNISQIDNDYLISYNSDTNKSILLNAKEEKNEIINSGDSNGFDIISVTNGEKYIFETLGTGGMSFAINKIYGNNNKVIYNKSISNFDVSIVDDNLYLKDVDKIVKYNTNGDILLTTDTFSNLKGLILNYAIYVDNGNLLMQDIDTKNTIEIAKWNNNLKYIGFASSYYYKKDLINNSNYEEGIYIIVENDTNKTNVYYVDSDLKVSEMQVENYLTIFLGGYLTNYKK